MENEKLDNIVKDILEILKKGNLDIFDLEYIRECVENEIKINLRLIDKKYTNFNKSRTC